MKTKSMTLGELINSKGYKQKFIVEQLLKKGFEVSQTHFSRLCSDKHTPHGNVFYEKVSEILGTSQQEIKDCFHDK